MSMVIDMPDQLDVSLANVEQPEDTAVCESLAESDSTADGHETEPIPTTANPTVHTIVVELEQSDILNEIWNAERQCRISEARVDELKAELKEAKGTYELAVLRLREISSQAGDHYGGVSRQSESAPAASLTIETTTPAALAESSQEECPTPSATSAPEDDSWRTVPLTNIGIASVKGLGKKKLKILLEFCPTLGAFEDLRSRVGRDATSLADLMPNGIGQEMCSAIEELVLDWLAKRHAAAATQQ